MPATKNQWYKIVAIEGGIVTDIGDGARYKYSITKHLASQYQYFKERGLVAFYKRGDQLGVKLLPSGNRIYRVEKGCKNA